MSKKKVINPLNTITSFNRIFRFTLRGNFYSPNIIASKRFGSSYTRSRSSGYRICLKRK